MEKEVCNAGNRGICFVACEDCICMYCDNKDCHLLRCYPDFDICVSDCKNYVPKDNEKKD